MIKKKKKEPFKNRPRWHDDVHWLRVLRVRVRTARRPRNARTDCGGHHSASGSACARARARVFSGAPRTRFGLYRIRGIAVGMAAAVPVAAVRCRTAVVSHAGGGRGDATASLSSPSAAAELHAYNDTGPFRFPFRLDWRRAADQWRADRRNG